MSVKLVPRDSFAYLGKNVGELLPVPVEMFHLFWKDVVSRQIKGPFGIKDYDINRLRTRLKAGVDRLWVAVHVKGAGFLPGQLLGAVITFVGMPPKDRSRKLFRHEKSLTIHFICGRRIQSWLPDAAEKLIAYGEAQECRQAFVLARKRWLQYIGPFLYGRFETLGYARDRFTMLGRNPHDGQQRPGHFRRVEHELPPGMSLDCARHRKRYYYITSLKGNAHAVL